MATARLLATRGAILSLADANAAGVEAALKSLEGPHKDKHLATTVDVRKSSEVNAWIEKTVQKVGKLHGAVNLAGVIRFGRPLKDETDEMWNFSMDINCSGVFYCLRAELNNMVDGGSIVSLLIFLSLAGWLDLSCCTLPADLT